MNKSKKHLGILLLIASAATLFFAIFLSDTTATENPKLSFWNQRRQGANIFNRSVSREDIRAAKAYGIAFIRLAPDKFLTAQRDFLIGSADKYVQLSDEDFVTLRHVLDMCDEERMPVVLTMLSLPGSRWKQNNGGKDDLRLWGDRAFIDQAAAFWRDLAGRLKGHPAVVGYNILNEPHPERIYDTMACHIQDVCQGEVQKKLSEFYAVVIERIRSVDPITPIILDSSAYADPNTFLI